MSIHVMQDERDFYEKFTNHLREQTELTFAIHGVPDEETPQIKDALQERLTAEVISLEHEKLRARGVSDEFLDASDLRPTLKELPLPEKERTLLEAKIHRVAKQITSREAGGSPEAGTERPPPAQLLEQRSLEPIVHFSHTWQSPDTMADTCICASTFPGTYNSLSNIYPLPPYPPGINYLKIACYLKGLPRDNMLYLRVEPFSSRREEMEVGLASEVEWHREIRAWHLCNGTVASVQHPSPSTNPKYMRLQRGCDGPHTLMFSDGFWNFSYFDDKQFWSVFGGKKLTFYWVEGPFTLPAWLSTHPTIRAKHSGKVLDVSDVSTANGARIQQWESGGGTNQQWVLRWLGGYGRDAYYKIESKHSGKVLDVVGKSTANGAEIQQYDWLDGINQIWRFEEVGDGYLKIVSAHSGKVLGVRDVSMANGARIQQWDYLGGNNQKWTFLEDKTARYRNIIKMRHHLTTNKLHSHALNYGHPGTSGQQQVTAFAGSDDNDLWRVKGPDGQPATFKEGEPVQHGDTIRLEHVLTGRNLHSHGGFPSPVTGQQEVTCYGNNGIGDANDNWRIEIEGGGTWDSGKRLRLIHVLTNHALHSHSGFSHPQWTAGQQEVTGFAGRDDNDWWSLFEIR
jgi:hypothetical protein